MSRTIHMQRIAEWILLLFVAFVILWRGGKSVDATWLLGVVTLLVLFSPLWFPALRVIGIKNGETRPQAMTVPLFVWATLLFFLAWSVLSYLTSATRTYGIDELIRDASCVLLFLWIVRRAGNHRASSLSEGFLWSVTIAAAIAVLFGLAVYVFQPVNRFTGTFLDWRFHTDYWPNAWAELVLLAWPLAALLAVHAKQSFQRWMCMGIAALLLGSLFLSYSRGGTIAFLGQAVCLGLFWAALVFRDVRVAKGVLQQWKPVAGACVATIVIALLFFAGGNALRSQRYEVQSVGDKITFQSAEGTSSISEREQFWKQAVDLALERPLLGYGPYSFRFAQPHLMQSVLATSDHPHNVFLKLAAERGIPAMVVFILFLGYVVGFSIRTLFFDRKADWSLGKDATTIALLVAVLGVLAHNLIDYNLQFVGIALPFWIALALLATHLAEKRPVSRASFTHWKVTRSLGRIEAITIILLLLIVLWEGSFLVVSSLGRRAEAQGDVRTALLWYERSAPELFSRDLLLARAELLISQGLLDDADGVLEEAIRQNSIDARAWRLRSELATRRNEKELALQYATHAYELGKYTDLGILRVLLDSARNAGHTEALRPRKQEFDALFADYAQAIGHNLHFIALGGAVEELQQVAERLGKLFPTDAKRYSAIAQDAFAHAQTERATFAARPAGLLW